MNSSCARFFFFKAICLASLLLLIMASASLAAALPLSTYRLRVRESINGLKSLQAINEDEDETEHEARAEQVLAEVRLKLPPSETVEWNGSTFQVNNQWLENALQHYEELAATATQRNAILAEATERLDSIAGALDELEKQSAQAGGASKDEEKARLAAILRRAEYAKKNAEEGSALTRLLRSFFRWLSSLFPKGPSMEPGRASTVSTIAQVFVVLLSLAIIAYAVWKFAPRLWRGRGRGAKKKKREARVVLGERLEPDQTSADLLAEAEALAREGHLRAAIRKGYIALLCELGDRKVLGLAQHKTNRDYLRAVRSQEQLYKEMQLLTSSFENHWYGFVPAHPDDWSAFRFHYQQALERQG